MSFINCETNQGFYSSFYPVGNGMLGQQPLLLTPQQQQLLHSTRKIAEAVINQEEIKTGLVPDHIVEHISPWRRVCSHLNPVQSNFYFVNHHVCHYDNHHQAREENNNAAFFFLATVVGGVAFGVFTYLINSAATEYKNIKKESAAFTFIADPFKNFPTNQKLNKIIEAAENILWRKERDSAHTVIRRVCLAGAAAFVCLGGATSSPCLISTGLALSLTAMSVKLTRSVYQFLTQYNEIDAQKIMDLALEIERDNLNPPPSAPPLDPDPPSYEEAISRISLPSEPSLYPQLKPVKGFQNYYPAANFPYGSWQPQAAPTSPYSFV